MRFISLFRKYPVWFDLVFLKHLTSGPSLCLSSGVHLSKLLLYTKAGSRNIPGCENIRKRALSGVRGE